MIVQASAFDEPNARASTMSGSPSVTTESSTLRVSSGRLAQTWLQLHSRGRKMTVEDWGLKTHGLPVWNLFRPGGGCHFGVNWSSEKDRLRSEIFVRRFFGEKSNEEIVSNPLS